MNDKAMHTQKNTNTKVENNESIVSDYTVFLDIVKFKVKVCQIVELISGLLNNQNE